ncbi:Clp protease ClpP, partial [Escherichia coli]|nr:Clp protease ClpP [Escherichia coli]
LMHRKPGKPPMKLLPCWRMRPGCPVPNVWHMDLLIR